MVAIFSGVAFSSSAEESPVAATQPATSAAP